MTIQESFAASQPTAPVVFIIFRRPDTTAKVFEVIRKAKPSKLYVIADGARSGNTQEEKLVSNTRSVIDGIDWNCDVTKIYSDENLGLRQRILTGLDTVFSIEENAVILEDDCLPSKSFFSFCSELLLRYKGSKDIALISGSNFAPASNLTEDYFFSRSMFIWGWATWAETWHAFRASPQVEEWPAELKSEISDTFASQIQKREFFGFMDIAKNLNTWDISLAVWIRQFRKITIIPRVNLIENIGFGEEATHTKFEAFDVQVKRGDFLQRINHPDLIEVNSSLERRMWRKKALKWLTFPISHPVDFVTRMLKFLNSRKLNG